MYKILLSMRYLRTRFIAMASVISVTLGVATLIVVNSVMNGFATEMKSRLHGILADIEMSAPGMGEIDNPELYLSELHEICGDELESMTCLVRVPGLITFAFNGRQWTQQVMMLGVDERTFSNVCEFLPFLMNSNKQKKLDFGLADSGYDARLGDCGWDYRRDKESNRRQVEAILELERRRNSYDALLGLENGANQQDQSGNPREPAVNFVPLPDSVPDINSVVSAQQEPATEAAITAFDPASRHRPQLSPSEMFNPNRDQYTGIILGIGLGSRYYIDPETGEKQERFLIRPGDDVSITLPSSGDNPQPVLDNCTLVDFYASNMHEYDSTFAFMPLARLQKIRGMIDPVTGSANVSSIHMRFRPGADLEKIRNRIDSHFAANCIYFGYAVQTWQDTQRPLLSAVDIELTILNILLFMIIAVAGFGILATFFMIVVEKTRDIGILKALGAPSSGVMSIFLGYGLSLGVVGTGAGILIGLIFVQQINVIADGIQWLTGREVFDPTMYFFSEIPTIVNPGMVIWVAFGAMMIAVMASVLPALRAARMHPVEALRYE